MRLQDRTLAEGTEETVRQARPPSEQCLLSAEAEGMGVAWVGRGMVCCDFSLNSTTLASTMGTEPGSKGIQDHSIIGLDSQDHVHLLQ